MIKRIIDIIFALLGFIVLFPVMLLIASVIKYKMGSPILFTQIRAGRYGEPIKIFKFRSMSNERGLDGQLLSNEERITKLGIFLRRWSLDELPQLVNILRGEMSVVGPRPLLMEYVPLYNDEQAKRNHVKPGITGWAQINGRNAISWEEKFTLDVWYVENQSIWLDLKIICLTLITIFRAKGISQEGVATTPFFTGSGSIYNTTESEVMALEDDCFNS